MLEASFQTSDEHKGLNVLTIAFEVFLNAIEKKTVSHRKLSGSKYIM